MKRLTSYLSRLNAATHSVLRSSLPALVLSLLSSPLSALPVDLSAPPGGLGPTSDQGAAIHWVEMTEIDFGGGMTFPLRMSFLSSRDEETGRDFGPGHWRTPLHDSRLMTKTEGRWPLLLPCGKVMSLFPKDGEKSVWATADEEWIARPKGANTLVTREDGWELEFSAKGLLIRLKADNGRTLLWTRDADGSLRSVAEFAGGKLLAPAYSVTRDPATRRVKSLRVSTRIGSKEWRYGYDASGRLTSIAFPDTSVVKNTYGSREDGQPWISITGRDAIATTLTWHKDNGSLLHDGVWSYDIQPQPDNNPIMRRTGPHGELEIQHDDAVNHRTLFTAAEGTQTIKQRVKSGPAKGKLESITRIVQKSEVGASEVSGQKLETLNLKPETQVLYSATYDSRGLLESETNALGHKTTHAYTFHGSGIHAGIKTHQKTDALGNSSSEEYDAKGNLISLTNALGKTFRQEYDDQNRLLKTTGPDGTVIETLSYTASGRIQTRTDALGAITTYGYDREGNRISVTDALGNTTKHEYDVRGNHTATIDALGHTTRYEYDEGGTLIATILPEVAQVEGLAKSPSNKNGAAANSTTRPTPQAPSRTSYTYDFAGRKLTTTSPDGTVTEANTYDALGRLTARTNALGHTTRFEYDVKNGSTGCLSCSTSGLPTRIISPTGRITERTYDTDRHLLTETIAAGTPEAATTRHTYDLAGNRLSTTDPLGRTTRYDYNALGHNLAIIYPDETKKTFTHNALGQILTETNELGYTTKNEYDPYGNLIAVTTPEGHTTRTLFGSGDDSSPKPKADDSSALPTLSTSPSALRSSGFAALRRPTAIISPSGVTTAFHYDLLGRKLTVTKAPGTAEAAITTHEYDAVGNEVASISPVGQKTTHSYDSRRRRISTTDAINRTWTFAYTDTAGPSGVPSCCGADPTANSRAATTIHPDGSRDEKIYNALGQIIETRDANVTTANDKLRTENRELRTGIRYAYDEDGRLTSLTDARGSITKWRYDARGKLAAKTYPDNTTELYEHDAAGQLISRLRPNGVTASYIYSPRNKLMSIRWSDGKTEPSTFAYDAVGQMTLAENFSAKITRTYNREGAIESETQTINDTFLSESTSPKPKKQQLGDSYKVTYTYTPEGRISTLLYPDGTQIRYAYGKRGQLVQVTEQRSKNEEHKSVASYRYRADGKISDLTMGNGIKTQKSYDSVGRLEKILHLDPNGVSLWSEFSRYDERSRRTARIHADQTADLFAYDPAGQVTSAAYALAAPKIAGSQSSSNLNGTDIPPTVNIDSVAETSSNFKASQTFEYDPVGNRKNVVVNDSSRITYITNESNQYSVLVSKVAEKSESFDLNYDALGNLLQDSRNTYNWDADCHLLTVVTQTTVGGSETNRFRYDALHRRVSAVAPDGKLTHFIHNGWNVLQEYSYIQKSHAKECQSYIWGTDISGAFQAAGGVGGLLRSNVSNSESYFSYDSNGNVSLLSAGNGRESARYQYDAFGQTILAKGSSAAKNRYRFSTKPLEGVSGLSFYGYRYLSLELGRWLSRDPLYELGGVNLYVSTLNNFVSAYDVLGLLVSNDQQMQMNGTPGFDPAAYQSGFNNSGQRYLASGYSSCGLTCEQLSAVLGSAMGGINGGNHAGGIGSSFMYPSSFNQSTIDNLTRQIADTSDDCCRGGERVSLVPSWTLSHSTLQECIDGSFSDRAIEGAGDIALEGAAVTGVVTTVGLTGWPAVVGAAAIGGLLRAADIQVDPFDDWGDFSREHSCNKQVCPSGAHSMQSGIQY